MQVFFIEVSPKWNDQLLNILSQYVLFVNKIVSKKAPPLLVAGPVKSF